MPSTQEYAGLTQGLSNVAAYHREGPERDARREEARMRQQRAGLELQEYQQNAPLRQSEAELRLEELQMGVRKMQANSLRETSYSAFKQYNETGNVKHLNNLLKQAKSNPVGQSNYGQWIKFDHLDPSNAAHTRLLREAGFTDPETAFSDPEIAQGFVVGLDENGETLLDIGKLQAATGYTEFMEDEELARMTKRAALASALRGQESADSRMIAQIAEQEDISVYEATKKFYEAKNTGRTTGTGIEREIERVMEDNPGMSREEASVIARQTIEPRTSKVKNLEQAQAVSDKLDAIGGGSFFSADLNNPTTRRAAGSLIIELEALTGKGLDPEEKRVARQLRSLTALGGAAGSKITDEETGIIDSTLHSLRRYFSNEVTGDAGTSAYETFRNIFRNSLYGASLTKTETTAFEAAAGKLKQQTGPVLAQLKVQMEDVKEQMQSIYDLNDERIAYFYLGKSLDEVDSIIQAMDERIIYFEDKARRTGPKEEVKVPKVAPKPVGERRTMKDIAAERGVI